MKRDAGLSPHNCDVLAQVFGGFFAAFSREARGQMLARMLADLGGSGVLLLDDQTHVVGRLAFEGGQVVLPAGGPPFPPLDLARAEYHVSRPRVGGVRKGAR